MKLSLLARTSTRPRKVDTPSDRGNSFGTNMAKRAFAIARFVRAEWKPSTPAGANTHRAPVRKQAIAASTRQAKGVPHRTSGRIRRPCQVSTTRQQPHQTHAAQRCAQHSKQHTQTKRAWHAAKATYQARIISNGLALSAGQRQVRPSPGQMRRRWPCPCRSTCIRPGDRQTQRCPLA